MIISKIKIHPFFYIILCIIVITGHFKTFSHFILLIGIHELGHITAGLCFKWKIEKIVILPFGGLTIFHEKINRPIYQELFIALFGPIFQIIFYYLYTKYGNNQPDIYVYHHALLLFNLLPIYPLDGSKILVLICNYFFPFSTSYKIGLWVSFLGLVLFPLFLHNLFYILVFLCLGKNLLEKHKQYHYIIELFLYERYEYTFAFKRKKIINGNHLYKMFRDCNHLFFIENHYHTEKEILKKHFYKLQ